MPTTSRIANALGDVGHLSLAAAAQNLMLLWLLSRMVWPGVAAFCAFAAVALIFDFCCYLGVPTVPRSSHIAISDQKVQPHHC